ncbi:hypothetical protein RF11_12856 [Thelohanellus kitauei]|uniref:Uncharacterized protein n=1 Tax=Thelohanellus kitauei TaxID=669202 RepID=A0A0C2MIF3_THEKT|nr:hypothetical protein RF11_12856 [Thelohanellus kitauei]
MKSQVPAIDSKFVNRVSKILKTTKNHVIQANVRSIRNLKERLESQPKNDRKIEKKENEIQRIRNIPFQEIAIVVSNQIADLFPFSEATKNKDQASQSTAQYLDWVQQTVLAVQNQLELSQSESPTLISKILTHKTFMKSIWACQRKLYQRIKTKEIRLALKEKRKRLKKQKSTTKYSQNMKQKKSQKIKEKEPEVQTFENAVKYEGDD